MFSEDSWYGVGHVKDAHSLKGELFVVVYSDEMPWLNNLEEAYLVHPDDLSDLHPIKIERHRIHKNGLIIKPDILSDRTQAESFKKFKFYVPKSLLETHPGEAPYLLEILNFKVFDKEGVEQGEITRFSGSDLQDVAVVTSSDGEFEVPFVEELIQEIDFENKKVIMEIPEGLKDL